MPSADALPPILRLQGVHKAFGSLRAVDGVAFEVQAGSLTGLIGPNGAGKTTTFDLIAGAQPCDRGEIIFDGQSLIGLAPYKVFQRGLARTFQVPRPFAQMTVLENLLIAPLDQLGERFQSNWWAFSRVRAQELALQERARGVLELCALATRPI